MPLHAAYVVANFRETQLTHVRPGEPVRLRIDALPGARVAGHRAFNQERIILPGFPGFSNAGASRMFPPSRRRSRPMTTAPATAASETVPLRTWLAVIGATLGAFMAVLNIQITNAALPDIQGAIGAGIDDGGWISTSYLITEIVVIPLTGWLARAFSVRLYLLVNAALFLVFSVACAFAGNLGQMIVLRGFQGFSGGVLIPMAFTIIMTTLPRSRQPIGLALFAISATFAPAIGPTIGGWLNDNYGWQFIFYVNLVPGAVMLGMLAVSLPATPMRLSLLRQGDWPGIATMAIGLACLQTMLEEGNKDDWFGSPFILKPGHRRRGHAAAVRGDRTHLAAPAAQPAPAAAPQFRLRHRRQLPPRCRPLRLHLRPAALPLPDPGLRRAADRRGARLDRPAATAADPAGPAHDAAHRRAPAGRRRLRPVRGQRLCHHASGRQLRRRNSCCPTSSAPSARPWC